MDSATLIVEIAGQSHSLECSADAAPRPEEAVFENENLLLFFPMPATCLVVVKAANGQPSEQFTFVPPFKSLKPSEWNPDHFQFRYLSAHEVQFVFRHGKRPGVFDLRYIPLRRSVVYRWQNAR